MYRPPKSVKRGPLRPASKSASPGVSRFAQLEQLVAAVLQLDTPADLVISRFFKDHPKLGSRDRNFFAETAWAVLRNRSWYNHLASSGAGSLNRRYALLAVLDQFGDAALERELTAQEREWLAHVALVKAAQVSPIVRQSVPDWLYDEWVAQVGDEEALACAKAMHLPAPLDLRVNTLLAKPADALALLQEDDISGEMVDLLPETIRVQGKPSLQRSRAFLQGWVEVQDLGSQLLAKLVAPKRGQFIVDFCAGAGGKSLAIGAALKNTGRLYALDVSATRLARFKPRLARSGLSNVWPSAISGPTDDRVKRLMGKADTVLVDAPCSGLGTLKRNPDLKWRMSADRVWGLERQQEEILACAATLVKPGGRLIYATCSPIARENQGIVDRFLAEHPDFRRVSASAVLESQRVVLPAAWDAFSAAGDLMLWPHRSGTDGFYAACLVRDIPPKD
jgi:16S rRNA (cytosine967-C5)-methyltransferase